MQRWETIDRAQEPGLGELVLARRGGEWVIRCAGQVLMSSRQHGSEASLARLGLEAAGGAARGRVFIGGLGLGFTLRAALDLLPPSSEVVVCELSPAIAKWNRERLGELANHPLADPRVTLWLEDAAAGLAKAGGSSRSGAGKARGESRNQKADSPGPKQVSYDAILLDTDNGPRALVQDANHRLYGLAGIARCFAALRPGGALAVWSAAPDPDYLKRLGEAGFRARAESVSARGSGRGQRHVIFLGVRP